MWYAYPLVERLLNMTQEEILTIKRRHEDELLQYDGVHAVSIGYKITDNIQTEELAIVIHTVDKKALDELPPDQIIPSEIEGVSTDVVESPPFQILPLVTDFNEAPADELIEDKKFRPVPGGVEIYTPRETYDSGICTLGMFARSTKEGESPEDIYLLTNAHCLIVPDQQVRQPQSPYPQDTIAYSTRIVNSEQVDGGIAKMINVSDASPYDILDIGTPTGTYDITIDDIGDPVTKTGRTTGTTEGVIAYVDVALIDIKNQIIIDSDIPFAAPGDSGSVVLLMSGEHRHNVVGLLWGGVLNYAIMSPIQAVMKDLEIDLITSNDSDS